MASESLLDHLRSCGTAVDCDTLDAAALEGLDQFVDSTSNQAIALRELKRPERQADLEAAVEHAQRLTEKWPYVPLEALAVEIAMVGLAIRITPHVSNVQHIQANPEYAYSRDMTVKAGRRIPSLFTELDPAYDRSRVCIKIPATFEGLQACKELEQSGIKTLATTLFCIEQAILAAEVGCHYVAPYLHELKRMTVPGYQDEGPTLALPVAIQEHYSAHAISKTRVLPAALTTPEECMAMAGAHHITIAPPLLKLLSETRYNAQHYTSLFTSTTARLDAHQADSQSSTGSQEAEYRMGVTRSKGGRSEQKLTQALNVFCDAQLELEKMIKTLLGNK